jgi:hypothetical protein
MRRRLWLVVAIVLFAAAAFLMSRGDAPRPEPRAKVEFPRHLRQAEYERMERRRTLPAAALPAGAEQPDRAPVLDPLLTALPAVPGKSAVVFEANALRHSPLGELFLNCFLTEDDRLEMREELGFDPLEDIDRVAFGGDGVMLVSGHFGAAKWEELQPDATFEPWGDKARFLRSRADGAGGESVAVWGEELVLVGDDRASLEAAIDESATYGEIYGVIAAEQLAEMLPPDQTGLRQRILEAAERIELHVDASGDVAIAADVRGPEADQVRDLGKSLGAALSLARIKAMAEGEDELVQLLEHARVQPLGDSFALELALPLALLEEHLGDACRKREPRDEIMPAAEVVD